MEPDRLIGETRIHVRFGTRPSFPSRSACIETFFGEDLDI